MKPRFKIGDKVYMSANAAENYNESTNREFTVDHVATSEAQHPGFDTGVNQPLYDLVGYPYSLYEYELRRYPVY
jgi:hypothetical protein